LFLLLIEALPRGWRLGERGYSCAAYAAGKVTGGRKSIDIISKLY